MDDTYPDNLQEENQELKELLRECRSEIEELNGGFYDSDEIYFDDLSHRINNELEAEM